MFDPGQCVRLSGAVGVFLPVDECKMCVNKIKLLFFCEQVLDTVSC